MNIICFNSISYIIEFFKILLAVTFLLNIPQRKIILIIFPISLLLISFTSSYFNFSDYTIIFGILSIVIISITMPVKKKIGQVILAYVCICIIDMVFSAICIFILNISVNSIQDNLWLEIIINSISLGIIIITSLVRKRTHNNYDISIKYLLILILGGISFALYITSIQLFGFEDNNYSYKDIAALGLSVSSIIFIIICALLLFNRNQNIHLKKEADINLKLLKAQEDYYNMLLKKEDETKAFRHDIQNHIYCMNTLFKDHKYDELGEYLSKMNTSLNELKSTINTGNKLVNAIVNDAIGKYNNINLKWIGLLPENILISSMDLCTVFSNILSNAFEAAEKCEQKNVEVSVKILESNLFITVTNNIKSHPRIIKGDYISTKTTGGHGYGLKNINKCLEKNNGSFELFFEEGICIAEIIFSNAIT